MVGLLLICTYRYIKPHHTELTPSRSSLNDPQEAVATCSEYGGVVMIMYTGSVNSNFHITCFIVGQLLSYDKTPKIQGSVENDRANVGNFSQGLKLFGAHDTCRRIKDFLQNANLGDKHKNACR